MVSNTKAYKIQKNYSSHIGGYQNSNLLVICGKNDKFLTFGNYRFSKFKGVYHNWNISSPSFSKVKDSNILIKNIEHLNVGIVKLITNIEVDNTNYNFVFDLYSFVKKQNNLSTKNDRPCLVFPYYRDDNQDGITLITHNGIIFETPISKHCLDKFTFKKSNLKIKLK